GTRGDDYSKVRVGIAQGTGSIRRRRCHGTRAGCRECAPIEFGTLSRRRNEKPHRQTLLSRAKPPLVGVGPESFKAAHGAAGGGGTVRLTRAKPRGRQNESKWSSIRDDRRRSLAAGVAVIRTDIRRC